MKQRLGDRISIAPRFQRSIRLDTDLRDGGALEGFACPRSSADVIVNMARHIQATGHAAFTWTGPYGTGKSSLALALCAALGAGADRREKAAQALGHDVKSALWRSLPPGSRGWLVVPVVGRRASLAQLIGEALEQQGYRSPSRQRWTDTAVLRALKSLTQEKRGGHGGLLIVLDELGKALEGAAHEDHDIFLLQEMAELASRSNKRMVVVGILHQTFDEYARRLAQDVRDEWAKVQGRFVDLIVNVTGDEQLELLARAITDRRRTRLATQPAKEVADLVRMARPGVSVELDRLLARCSPLHPVTACLLGPLSRRRFGQNQRSLFAFLNSAEPYGLRDFLANAGTDELYMPTRLWDYLQANLEPAILASADSHRWSTALEALERCAGFGPSALEVSLLKTIALIDLFGERSGVNASPDLLRCAASPQASASSVNKALKQLAERSCVIYRRHAGAYTLFAGSDFDIDNSVGAVTPPPDAVDMGRLRDLAGLQPMLAKRHYHTTGAIRWFNVELARLEDLAEMAGKSDANEAAGCFLIAIPGRGESQENAKSICAEVAAKAPLNVVIGLSEHAWPIMELARELVALEIVEGRPELRGDAVARREVAARQSELRGRLEAGLQRMVHEALWYRHGEEPLRLTAPEINLLASQIADTRYAKAPRILNELLNRDRPSSQAVKAQKDLMKRMLAGRGKARLGLEGWPAEAGLFDSVLVTTRLYRKTAKGGWAFVEPSSRTDPAGLLSLWKAGLELLRASDSSVSLAELYKLWRRPPFGLKEGLMPVMAIALYSVHREHLAIYRQGVFQPEMTDLDVDLMTSDPGHVHLRWMVVRGKTERILRGLSGFASTFESWCEGETSALAVARTIVAEYDSLPAWTKRTKELPASAKRLSECLRHAADPNELLFQQLPQIATDGTGARTELEMVAFIQAAFKELQESYPRMLGQLEKVLLKELEVVPNKAGLARLRERAANLHHVTGDLRLNAFVNRLTDYSGTLADKEGVVGLALEKKPGDWVDTDLAEARLRIAELAHSFKRHEAFTRVAGREDKRRRMAVIVPREGVPCAMLGEFDVMDHDRVDVDALIGAVETVLTKSNQSRKSIILAALAELSARYMQPAASAPKRKTG